jgi:hypothetical protein
MTVSGPWAFGDSELFGVNLSHAVRVEIYYEGPGPSELVIYFHGGDQLYEAFRTTKPTAAESIRNALIAGAGAWTRVAGDAVESIVDLHHVEAVRVSGGYASLRGRWGVELGQTDSPDQLKELFAGLRRVS